MRSGFGLGLNETFGLGHNFGSKIQNSTKSREIIYFYFKYQSVYTEQEKNKKYFARYFSNGSNILCLTIWRLCFINKSPNMLIIELGGYSVTNGTHCRYRGEGQVDTGYHNARYDGQVGIGDRQLLGCSWYLLADGSQFYPMCSILPNGFSSAKHQSPLAKHLLTSAKYRSTHWWLPSAKSHSSFFEIGCCHRVKMY